MDLNWMESVIYGFLSGLMDIVPLSAQAHRILLMKFFGISGGTDVMRLAVHIGVFGGLYYSCQSQIVRINRARALARVPKRRRKRPLDTRSLMDWSMLKTMLIPMVVGLFLYKYNTAMRDNLLLVAIFLLVNGIILYVPQFLPGSNRDSRTLTRLEGFLMGLGATASTLPGISAVGAAVSIGSVCGVERGFCLSMALMMNLALNLGGNRRCLYSVYQWTGCDFLWNSDSLSCHGTDCLWRLPAGNQDHANSVRESWLFWLCVLLRRTVPVYLYFESDGVGGITWQVKKLPVGLRKLFRTPRKK